MKRPQIFGILNITPDSFSDGGRFLAPEAALAQAAKLMQDGADALDIGGASSNPDSARVPAEVEIARLAPVVAKAKTEGWPVSIDSFAPETQAWALKQEVRWLNDIRGFPEPALYPALAASGKTLIVMHSVQGGPATRADVDPATIMGRIFGFFDARVAALTGAGVRRENLILDPGMGFFLGSDPEVSLTVLRRLPELKARYGLPLLVSVSRKSFLRKLAGRPAEAAGPASLAAELYAALNGADMLRTHDPAALRDALTIWSHIAGPEDGGLSP
jgi:dihydropteroate synthase type 2